MQNCMSAGLQVCDSEMSRFVFSITDQNVTVSAWSHQGGDRCSCSSDRPPKEFHKQEPTSTHLCNKAYKQ